MHRTVAYGLSLLAVLTVTGCSVPWKTTVNTSQVTNSSTPVNASSAGVQIGNQAPSFSLKGYHGGATESLQSLLAKGKPVILNAFASWCGPCNDEAPDLQRMAKQYASKVTFVGVNITGDDTMSGLQQFVNKHGVTYPILLDPKADFANAYDILGLPTTYVIGTDGKIVDVIKGSMSKAQIQSLFEQAQGE